MAATDAIAINTSANPAYIPTTGPGGTGFLLAFIVADTTFLTALKAAAVPANTIAIVVSTGSGFITYDNVNWSPLW